MARFPLTSTAYQTDLKGHGDTAIPTAEFKAIFDEVRLNAEDFTPEGFKPGTSGQTELYRKLQADTKISESSIWKGVSG